MDFARRSVGHCVRPVAVHFSPFGSFRLRFPIWYAVSAILPAFLPVNHHLLPSRPILSPIYVLCHVFRRLHPSTFCCRLQTADCSLPCFFPPPFFP